MRDARRTTWLSETVAPSSKAPLSYISIERSDSALDATECPSENSPTTVEAHLSSVSLLGCHSLELNPIFLSALFVEPHTLYVQRIVGANLSREASQRTNWCRISIAGA